LRRSTTQQNARKLRTNSHQNGHRNPQQIFFNVYAGFGISPDTLDGCLVAVLASKPL
jgi:hypothetical protein